MGVPSKPKPTIENLVSVVKRGRIKSFSDLCDHFDRGPSYMGALIAEARKKKFAIDIAGESVGIRPAAANDSIVDIAVSQAGNPHLLAVASDLHFGSKYHLRHQLLDFLHRAYASGVRNFLLPGDDLDGCYRHGRWELTHHGFQDQVEDFCKGLPHWRDANYYGISGNHDETFEKESGMVVHSAIEDHFRAQGRRDLHMLGARGAYLRLRAPRERRGILVELWHPLKGPAYALTYGIQKHIEKYSPGQKPDMLFVGHWHQSVYTVIRGVHAMSCGTFQGGGGSFGKALGGAPSIGGWVVEWAVTPEGAVRHVKPTWSAYYENESIREVCLG